MVWFRLYLGKKEQTKRTKSLLQLMFFYKMNKLKSFREDFSILMNSSGFASASAKIFITLKLGVNLWLPTSLGFCLYCEDVIGSISSYI